MAGGRAGQGAFMLYTTMNTFLSLTPGSILSTQKERREAAFRNLSWQNGEGLARTYLYDLLPFLYFT